MPRLSAAKFVWTGPTNGETSMPAGIIFDGVGRAGALWEFKVSDTLSMLISAGSGGGSGGHYTSGAASDYGGGGGGGGAVCIDFPLTFLPGHLYTFSAGDKGTLGANGGDTYIVNLTTTEVLLHLTGGRAGAVSNGSSPGVGGAGGQGLIGGNIIDGGGGGTFPSSAIVNISGGGIEGSGGGGGGGFGGPSAGPSLPAGDGAGTRKGIGGIGGDKVSVQPTAGANAIPIGGVGGTGGCTLISPSADGGGGGGGGQSGLIVDIPFGLQLAAGGGGGGYGANGISTGGITPGGQGDSGKIYFSGTAYVVPTLVSYPGSVAPDTYPRHFQRIIKGY